MMMTPKPQSPPSSQDGVSLVEVTVVLVLAVLMLATLHAALSSSISARRSTHHNDQVHLMATEFRAMIQEMSFGTLSDPLPTAAALTEFFDDDGDPGALTLHQLRRAANQPNGVAFSIDQDGLRGTWLIVVTNDLDRNGDTSGPREGRGDLLRIDIEFDGRQRFTTLRTAEPGSAQLDNIDYLIGS